MQFSLYTQNLVEQLCYIKESLKLLGYKLPWNSCESASLPVGHFKFIQVPALLRHTDTANHECLP